MRSVKSGKDKKLFVYIAAFLIAALAGSVSAALQAVGPTNPANGYPAWYQDTGGLALEQCFEPANAKCMADPVIVGNSVSEQVGFGDEAFYWLTEALMNTKKADGTNGRALMVLALENAWINGGPTAGDQMVFGRARFFIDVPAAGRYKITHPFGVAFFDVSQERINATNGIRAINANLLGESGFDAAASTNIPLGDVGCAAAPCDFSLALPSGIGPFLTWDTFNIDPNQSDPALFVAQTGKRHVGDPLVEHRIKGSPFGTNFLRIEGPGGVDIDPALAGIQNIIETDLFTVGGRVAVIDTVPPVIGAASPLTVAVGSTNMPATVNITDNLGTTLVTIDLSSLGNTSTATLNGQQEVPSTSSTASGSGTFTIDTQANSLSFNINYTGLTGGQETAAHIHGPAAAGVENTSVFNLPLGSSKSGTWNYPESLEADILAGRTYVNIHTTLFADGEIRGQILPASDIRTMILTAGNRTSGIWGAVIPSVSRTGTFSLPLFVTDGSNVVNTNFNLTVFSPIAEVNVTPFTATITASNTQQLNATVTAQNGTQVQATIVWTSNNNSVATVDTSGLVTAVAAGTATITANATANGQTLAGTATIRVNASTTLASVSVTPATATMTAGTTLQMTATPLDNTGAAFLGATISWNSSNTTVASVNANGLVTAVALGTTTITATATNGANTVFGTSEITVSTCVTGADTNGNGAISNLELLNYVRDWKAGSVSNLLALRAIGFWKAGTGC